MAETKPEFTLETVQNALDAVVSATKQATTARVQELKQAAVANGGRVVQEECGGALVKMQMDGRSSLAKQLKNVKHPDITFTASRNRRSPGFYSVKVKNHIQGDAQVSLQNCSIHERGAEAAAKELESRFGCKTMVLRYRD